MVISPDRFSSELAIGYFNYAVFMQDDIYFQKALVLAKTMPNNLYCKKIIDVLKDKKLKYL